MFIFDDNGRNFLNLKLPQAVQLVVALSLVAVFLMTALILRYKKPQILKKFATIYGIAFLLFCLGVIIFNVVTDYISDSEDYKSYQLYIAIGIFIAILVVLAFVFTRKDNGKTDAKALAYAAICLSVSFALSYIRLFRMPQGGSITLASVTLLGLYSYMFGTKRGLLACFAYGVLQSLQDPWVVHPVQFLLDYPLAYTMFGFVGIFRNKLTNPKIQLILGFVVAVVLRYICHFFSGAVFFGEYGEDFGIFNKWAWGAIYNLPVLIDGAVATLVGFAVFSNNAANNLLLSEGIDCKH